MKLLIASSALALGLVVGVPYYGLPFFYDYFERPLSQGGFGWSRPAITLGLPLGTLVTLFAGPLLVPRVAPRLALLLGAFTCSLAILGMGFMPPSLWTYYALWLLYMSGWTFSGPLIHQIVLTRRLDKARGSGLALSSLGISICGALSVRFLLPPLTAAYGFRFALGCIGALILAALPFLWIMLHGHPDSTRPLGSGAQPSQPLASLLRQRSFWLILVGSTLTISAIGAISQHLKLIFAERGFAPQTLLDRVYGESMLVMLFAGATGRLCFGWLSDRFPKPRVISGAFLLMALSAPLLLQLQPPATPYLFALLFGFGMGVDFLLTPLLATEHFGPSSLARVMSIVFPLNTIGQTWFPYLISLLREQSDSYLLPLGVVFTCALLGRLTMSLLPTTGPAFVQRTSTADSSQV